MRTFVRRRSAYLKGMVSFCVLFLSFITLTSAQTVQSTAPASSIGSTSVSPQFQTFQAEQQTLVAEVQNLIAQGATSDQIQAWAQQNAAQIIAQQKLAQAISASQPVQPVTYITDVDVPAGASQTMEDFLSARATLFNLWVQLHNQKLQSSGTVNDALVITSFTQQNAPALQTQAQRTLVLAVESDQHALPILPSLIIPSGTTPQVAKFLTLRDQLMRGFIQLHNQNTTSTPAVRDAALELWVQQNAASLLQLRQECQNFTTTSLTPAS